MRLHRGIATSVVATLAATTASIATTAPAEAASGWKTGTTFKEGRAQVCTEVNAADGSAVVRVRMNNRRGDLTLSAYVTSVRADGRPDRTLVTTRYVGAGGISAPAATGKLTASDSFFVEIAQRFDEGAGIVKTSSRTFVVRDTKTC